MNMVTVIIPTHNRYEQLKRAIQSVKKQTIKNIELIVVNDASSDETYEYLESIKSNEIKVIHNEESKGCAGARNIGIKQAQGEYIAFLDDDDEFLPKKLEMHLGVMENSKIDITYSDMLRVCRDGSLYYWESPELETGKRYNMQIHDFCGMSLAMQQIVIKRTVINTVGLLDENSPNMEDVEFYIKAVERCNIYHIKQPTVLYYDNAGVSENHYKTIISRILLTEKYVDVLQGVPNGIRKQLDYIMFQIKMIAFGNRNIEIYQYIKLLQSLNTEWIIEMRRLDTKLFKILTQIITMFLEVENSGDIKVFSQNKIRIINELIMHEKEQNRYRLQTERNSDSVLEKLESRTSFFCTKGVKIIDTDSLYTVRLYSVKSKILFWSDENVVKKFIIRVIEDEISECFGKASFITSNTKINEIKLISEIKKGWNTITLNERKDSNIYILELLSTE